MKYESNFVLALPLRTYLPRAFPLLRGGMYGTKTSLFPVQRPPCQNACTASYQPCLFEVFEKRAGGCETRQQPRKHQHQLNQKVITASATLCPTSIPCQNVVGGGVESQERDLPPVALQIDKRLGLRLREAVLGDTPDLNRAVLRATGHELRCEHMGSGRWINQSIDESMNRVPTRRPSRKITRESQVPHTVVSHDSPTSCRS